MTTKGFFAYTDHGILVGPTIEAGVADFNQRTRDVKVTTWKEIDIAGKFIASQVLGSISTAEFLVADISKLNFNVTFEIAYAIGRGKPVMLVRMGAMGPVGGGVDEVGLFDTIGYKTYNNRDEVRGLLQAPPTMPLLPQNIERNHSAPVYLIDSQFQTDHITRLISRVKKARLFFRSFDPVEQPRMSAPDAIAQVGQSFGVLLHLLPSTIEGASVHNLRAAFLAGLAMGMDRVLSVMQLGYDPVPLDYRDFAQPYTALHQIDAIVSEFAPRVTEAMQSTTFTLLPEPATLLARMNIGTSSAENEMADLGQYFIQTDAFLSTRRGEVRLVAGRKGSGKTAVFAQLRDDLRRDRRRIVLDLKPAGYQLLKFKESVLRLMEEGTFYHTITAFWEYLLLLEISYKLLEKDRQRHIHDQSIYAMYRSLSDRYRADTFVSEGDFSERMGLLLDSIKDRHRDKYGENYPSLSEAQITELIYMHDVSTLRDTVVGYLKTKTELWLLFDNLDKGWPTQGLTHDDVLIIRSLLEATRKLERDLTRHDVTAHSVVFLRNDVYEILVEETPDRGKESKVFLDWTDPDLLRELLRRRLVFGGVPTDSSFDQAWQTICVSHIDGEDTSQYMIDRSLMRPRGLIDIVKYCRSYAVNLGHTQIQVEDIRKGLYNASCDLRTDLGLEMRDVLPESDAILYRFFEQSSHVRAEQLEDLLDTRTPQLRAACIENLLWYGFLGIVRADGEADYIYNVNYDMNVLNELVERAASKGELVYAINPAFWAGLRIVPSDVTLRH